jgi:hypothetical protein
MTTLPLASALDSWAPVSSAPLAAMVKSVGSMSQLPARPWAAALVTLAEFAISTCAALVSMAPPLPPVGALASSVPPTFTVPSVMPPSSVMAP